MLPDLTVDCLTIRCSWGPLLSTSAISSLSILWPQRTQDIIRWPKKSCKAEAPISRQTMISLTFFLGLRPPHRQTVLRTFPLVLRSRTNQQKDSSPGHICQCQILQDWVVPSFVLPRFCPPPHQAASFLCSPVSTAKWSLYKLCGSFLLCILWENSTGPSVDLSEEYFMVTLQWGLMMSCQGRL